MIEQSRDEYLEISNLIREASDSVFRYTNLLVTFSAAAFAFLAEDIFSSGGAKPASLIILSIVIIITLMIQLGINYKCESHNRLAGYRSLIASEIFNKELKEGDKGYDRLSTSFSVCVDHMNRVYSGDSFDFDIIEERFFHAAGIFEGLDEEYEIDKFVAKSFPKRIQPIIDGDETYHEGSDASVSRGIFYPFIMLIRLMIGFYRKRGTWGFPNVVNRMITFVVLCEIITLGILLYIFISTNFASWFCACSKNYDPSFQDLSYGSFLILLFTTALILLRAVSIEWQDIMVGSKRISVYFVNFLPFRMIYLRDMYGKDVEPYYSGVSWNIKEMV